MIGALAAGAWLLGVAAIWSGAVQLAGPVQFNPAQPGVIAKYWVTAFLFPLTILWLALTETRHGGFGRKYAFLGDLSYSSYLLHFPLQMLVMGVLIQARATQEVFYSPVLLLLFFAVLIAVSLASHRYFEVPVQRYLREKCRAAG
jgi:peptidoglycan/LPS O-acetylase OafA/YrhL